MRVDLLRCMLVLGVLILTSDFVFYPIVTGREYVLMFGTLVLGFYQYIIEDLRI